MAASKPPVALVGAGALGTALARRLAQRGYPLCGILSSGAETARALAARVDAPLGSAALRDLPAQARVVFCCVPDALVSYVAEELALLPHDWTDCVVAHTSGALTAAALAPLARRGALVLSFHPVQSFTRATPPEAFEGIFVGLEGDPRAVAFGTTLAADLGARPIPLQAAAKARYHLATAIASNFFVTLMALAGEVLADAGIDRTTGAALLRPLIQGTWQNLREQLPEGALTGPIARGDLETVAQHAEALALHLPHLAPVYVALAAETVRVAVRGSMLAPEQAQRMLDVLHALLEAPDNPFS